MIKENPILNVNEFRKAIEFLVSPGYPFEVRAISSSKVNYSGYFMSAEEVLEAWKYCDFRGCNIYITLQDVKEACASRQNRGRFVKNFTPTTADSDIEGYRWLFIDVDPTRVAGTSSSDEELLHAVDTAKKVKAYLDGIGFPRPIRAYSGNGYHLLYRISAGLDKKPVIERCLKSLSLQFDDEHVTIDTKVFNPARICKLYGTLAQKGMSTESRPHRMSRIIDDVFEPQVVTSACLQKLAETLPHETTEYKSYNSYSPSEFNLDEWLDRYGIGYQKKGEWQGNTKYILDCCPFDSSHKGKDAIILHKANGPIAFKCFHNSCADKHWPDVRKLFEPDAYERKQNEVDNRYRDGWQQHNRNKNLLLTKELSQAELATKGEPIWEDMSYIMNKNEPEKEFILTGITDFDREVGGLAKGVLSVLSGLRGSGKSTLLGQISLNAIEAKQRVLFYSGELKDKKFWEWISRQAAGNDQRILIRSGQYKKIVSVANDAQKAIAMWIGDNLYLYNNNYGNDYSVLAGQIRRKIIDSKADMVVLDNLMMLDLSGVSDDRRDDLYRRQSLFMQDLKAMAAECNVHIILVAHPRKPQGFIRIHDIAGTGDIGNIVDNVFIIHRHNQDFVNGYKSYFNIKEKTQDKEKRELADIDSPISNVVEICKDRDNGTVDKMISLYFEPASKRLCNYPGENNVYGWHDVWKEISEDMEDEKGW